MLHIAALLKPLLSDVCLQVQHCAVTAIGRMAHTSRTASRAVLNENLLPTLLCNIDQRNVKSLQCMFKTEVVTKTITENVQEISAVRS